MRFTFIVRIICGVLLVLATLTWGAHIRLLSLECRTIDPTFCAFEYCVMKPRSRDIKEISILIKLLKKPVTNITISGNVKPRFKSPFYSFKVDGCIFLKSKRRNLIADAFYKFLRMEIYTNMNHSCPFDHDLLVDRLQVDESFNLPLPIDIGEYVITTHWTAYNILRATVYLIITISG